MKIRDRIKTPLGLAIIAALAIGVLVLGGIVVNRLFFAPGAAKVERAQDKADAGGARVQAENARDGIATGDRIIERNHEIERITRENTVRIMAAPGAGVAADPGFAPAWRSALCLRDAYRDSAACVGMSDPVALVGDTAYPAGADPR